MMYLNLFTDSYEIAEYERQCRLAANCRELIAAIKYRGIDEEMGKIARKHRLYQPYEIDYAEAAYRFDREVDYPYNSSFDEIRHGMREEIAGQIAMVKGISVDDIDLYGDEVDEIFDNINAHSVAEQIQDLDYKINKTYYWDIAWERFTEKLIYQSENYVDLILPR